MIKVPYWGFSGGASLPGLRVILEIEENYRTNCNWRLKPCCGLFRGLQEQLLEFPVRPLLLFWSKILQYCVPSTGFGCKIYFKNKHMPLQNVILSNYIYCLKCVFSKEVQTDLAINVEPPKTSHCRGGHWIVRYSKLIWACGLLYL